MTITIIRKCPFCGGEATYFSYDPYDGYQGDCTNHRVQCTKCRAMIEGSTKELSIALWNSRLG